MDNQENSSTGLNLRVGNVANIPEEIVTVPIFISGATGLQSLGITLNYDTDFLTLIDPNPDTATNEGVKRTGIAENWRITSGEGENPDRELPNPVANVNQETGEVRISLINPGNPVTVDSGKIIEIDFQISSDAGVETQAAIDLQEAEFGIDNEAKILADEDLDDGNVSVSPTVLTLTGGTAQIAYVAYYGRPADNGGRNFWNSVLAENEVSYAPRVRDLLTGSEQDAYDRIVNDFGTSEEADRLFGNIQSNRDKVNQVYQFAFDRDGDEQGLNFWTEQLELNNITLATFAMEVALGAQNEDIVVLSNKIKSADLFSGSIDTQGEIEGYSGSTGEIFGRNWLGGLGEIISSQAQVDAALADLVDD